MATIRVGVDLECVLTEAYYCGSLPMLASAKAADYAGPLDMQRG